MNISPIERLCGHVVTPGDKSISHRAVMISALASGQSEIRGLSHGADVLATVEIMQQLGATVSLSDVVTVEGPASGLRPSSVTLDCGNSGTTIRLLMGLLMGVRGEHLLDGDESLRRRPMNRVALPLVAMGAEFSHPAAELHAPLEMRVVTSPIGISYHVPVPSAQVKSAILFGGLSADGPTTVIEDTKTRTNTEEMLTLAGIELSVSEDSAQRIIHMQSGRPESREWFVPQDPSQAAFFVVAALIHRDADLTFQDIYGGAERNGYLDVLLRMGANIEVSSSSGLLNLRAKSSDLVATIVHSTEIPSVDEVPILVVAAAAASGTTIFVDMAELRLKESDRFANSISLARGLGATVSIDGDSFSVTGVGASRYFEKVSGDYPGDHRMTMATVIAGVCGSGAEIFHPESTHSSFPTFFQVLTSLSS